MKSIFWSICCICIQTGIVAQSTASDLQVKTFELFEDLSMAEEKNIPYESGYIDDLSKVCRVSNYAADRLIREYIKSTQKGVSLNNVTDAVSIITSKIPLYADHIGNNDGLISRDELMSFKQMATRSDAFVYLFCMISVYHKQ
jgi:hypothetical protein